MNVNGALKKERQDKFKKRAPEQKFGTRETIRLNILRLNGLDTKKKKKKNGTGKWKDYTSIKLCRRAKTITSIIFLELVFSIRFARCFSTVRSEIES